MRQHRHRKYKEGTRGEKDISHDLPSPLYWTLHTQGHQRLEKTAAAHFACDTNRPYKVQLQKPAERPTKAKDNDASIVDLYLPSYLITGYQIGLTVHQDPPRIPLREIPGGLLTYRFGIPAPVSFCSQLSVLPACSL
jgi:hypothetical protein